MKDKEHPGLAAAVKLAGGKVALAKMIGKNHNYITYRMDRGRGLPVELAVLVAPKLGIKLSTLVDKTA